MHRLRLLLVLGFVLTLGASVARAQDGADVFKDQASDQTSTSKPKKAKTNTTSDHRRHWWSPPSWFHKKHDKAAHNKSGKNPFNKPAAAAAPASTSSSKTGTSTTASATAPAPPLKTRTGATATSSTAKTGTGVHTATKTGSSRNISSRKKTTAAVTGKKPVKNDCSPEQAKKGGCPADKGSNQKPKTSS